MCNLFDICEADFIQSVIEVSEDWTRKSWEKCKRDEILYVLNSFIMVIEDIHMGGLTPNIIIEERINLIIDRIVGEIEVERSVILGSHDIEVLETIIIKLLRFIAEDLRHDQNDRKY